MNDIDPLKTENSTDHVPEEQTVGECPESSKASAQLKSALEKLRALIRILRTRLSESRLPEKCRSLFSLLGTKFKESRFASALSALTVKVRESRFASALSSLAAKIKESRFVRKLSETVQKVISRLVPLKGRLASLDKNTWIIVGICCAALIFSLFYTLTPVPVKDAVEVQEEPVLPITVEEDIPAKSEEAALSDEELWRANHAINSDYVGQIRFRSGIIDLPFCQGASNDTYLRTDWETKQYDLYGTVFLDYRNELDDQNLILYGHNVYPSYDPTQTEMFTPLLLLIDQENYEQNKYIELVLEGETRTYLVTDVYYCDLYKEDPDDEESEYRTNDSLQYYHPVYSDSYLDRYLRAVKTKDFYDTGAAITDEDEFITLQTCVEYHEDLRLIVLAKRVGTTRWETAQETAQETNE